MPSCVFFAQGYRTIDLFVPSPEQLGAAYSKSRNLTVIIFVCVAFAHYLIGVGYSLFPFSY